MASGAMKIGSFLSSAAPKPAQPQPQPVAISTAPVSQNFQNFRNQSITSRPTLQSQPSVTESDNYYQQYPPTSDSVPTDSYVNQTQDVYVSESNDLYGYNQIGSTNRELPKQDSLDYPSLEEEDMYNKRRDSLNDRGYLENQNSIDSYGQDEQINGVNSGYNETNEESPVSVIQVSDLEPSGLDEHDPRSRGRNLQNSLVEPYVPRLSPNGSKARDSISEVPYMEPGLHDILPEPTGSPPPDTRAPQDVRGNISSKSIRIFIHRCRI
jgi:hypothetical protein